MHEASLVASLCQEVEEIAQKQGAKKVLQIVVRIGKLSGVEIEAFRFAFEAYQRGHPLLAKTDLIIEEIPVKRWCFSCGQKFDTSPPCPYCGSFHTLPLQGEELELFRLELAL